jgi:hypothetical protein
MGPDVENERTTKPDSAASALSAGLGAIVDDAIIRGYAGKCVFCKFFRPAYEPGPRECGHWVDDEGWCVRYPPVFVGGDSDAYDVCDQGRYKQPCVCGSDECGEFVQSSTAPNVK